MGAQLGEKTGGSKREAYGARLSWSATEILARRFSLVQGLQPRLSEWVLRSEHCDVGFRFIEDPNWRTHWNRAAVRGTQPFVEL
jgi:hypothetical protein